MNNNFDLNNRMSNNTQPTGLISIANTCYLPFTIILYIYKKIRQLRVSWP